MEGLDISDMTLGVVLYKTFVTKKRQQLFSLSFWSYLFFLR